MPSSWNLKRPCAGYSGMSRDELLVFGGGQGLGRPNVKMCHFLITNQWKNNVFEDSAEDYFSETPGSLAADGPNLQLPNLF